MLIQLLHYYSHASFPIGHCAKQSLHVTSIPCTNFQIPDSGPISKFWRIESQICRILFLIPIHTRPLNQTIACNLCTEHAVCRCLHKTTKLASSALSLQTFLLGHRFLAIELENELLPLYIKTLQTEHIVFSSCQVIRLTSQRNSGGRYLGYAERTIQEK